MKAVSNLTGGSPRRASLAVAFAAGVVLLAAPLGAAVAVNPWSGAQAATTNVAPADAFGVNVLEQADNGAAPAPVAANKMGTERAVGEWTPTAGVVGSPKR